MLLAATNENKSRVAWLLGTHRNTIRRRLQKIRRMLRECPIENVSGTLVPIQPQPSAALQVKAEQWEPLAYLAQDSRRRGAFNARLILALAFGAVLHPNPAKIEDNSAHHLTLETSI